MKEGIDQGVVGPEVIPSSSMSERLVITFHWKSEQRSVCLSYTEYATLIHAKCSELERTVSLQGHYRGAFTRGVWFYVRIEDFLKPTLTTTSEPDFLTFNCAGCFWRTYALQTSKYRLPEANLEKGCGMCSWRTR